MKKSSISYIYTSIALIFGVLAPGYGAARADSQMSLRAAVGTDVSLGLGYGAGLRFLKSSGLQTMEFGPDLFIAKSTYTSQEFHQYTETTDLKVFAVRINWLSDYAPKQQSTYWVYGVGAAAISMVWEESSPTDTSLGTPCCGGGSKHSKDGTAFGALLTIGAGKSLTENVDVRVEFPIIIIPSPVGNAAAFIPTATLSLGIGF
ncbi:MAG: hypothetical protein AABY83_09685 [Pseudomonadota bacterium]